MAERADRYQQALVHLTSLPPPTPITVTANWMRTLADDLRAFVDDCEAIKNDDKQRVFGLLNAPLIVSLDDHRSY